MSSSQWYYLKDGQAGGPMSIEEIVKLISSGTLLPHDMVFRDGSNKWKSAREWEELQTALSKSPEGAEWDDHNLWVVLLKKPPEKGIGFDQKGPFTTDQIRSSIEQGELTYKDFAWKNGESEWKKIADIPELNRFLLEAPLTEEEQYLKQLKENIVVENEVDASVQKEQSTTVDEQGSEQKIFDSVERIERKVVEVVEEELPPPEASPQDEVQIFVEQSRSQYDVDQNLRANPGLQVNKGPQSDENTQLNEKTQLNKKTQPDESEKASENLIVKNKQNLKSEDKKESPQSLKSLKVNIGEGRTKNKKIKVTQKKLSLMVRRVSAIEQFYDRYKNNKKVVFTALGLFICLFSGALFWSSLVKSGLFEVKSTGSRPEIISKEMSSPEPVAVKPIEKKAAPEVAKRESTPPAVKEPIQKEEIKALPKPVTVATTQIQITQGDWRSNKRYLLVTSNGSKGQTLEVLAYSNIGESKNGSSFFKRMKVAVGREKIYLGSEFQDGQYRFDIFNDQVKESRTVFIGKKNKKFKETVWKIKKEMVFDHLEERNRLFNLYSGLVEALRKHPALGGKHDLKAWSLAVDRSLDYKSVTDRAIDKKLHPSFWVELKFRRLEIIDIIKEASKGENVDVQLKSVSSTLGRGVSSVQKLSLWN